MVFWEWFQCWLGFVLKSMMHGERATIYYLQAENKVLRELLDEARGGKRLLLKDRQKRFLARFAKLVGNKRLTALEPLFTPDTLLRWHRELVARKYRPKRSTGRPPIDQATRDLVLRLAGENECWGYRRIVGALKHLDLKVSASTVRRILREAGLEPSPQRRRKLTWKRFLQCQFAGLAAADFFTKEVWTLHGLKRFHVLVVMDLITRRVEVAGVAPEPCGAWVRQRFCELTDFDHGFLNGKKYLIVDRGTVFTDQAATVLAAEGVKMLRLPPKSPNLNAHVERFIRTIKAEAFDRMLVFGEKHLHTILTEFTEHYHRERPHQGLGNELIEPPAPNAGESIRCKYRLGGLLKYYHRAA